jgi:hypothetical protein
MMRRAWRCRGNTDLRRGEDDNSEKKADLKDVMGRKAEGIGEAAHLDGNRRATHQRQRGGQVKLRC